MRMHVGCWGDCVTEQSTVPSLPALNESLEKLLSNKNLDKLVTPGEQMVLDHLHKFIKETMLRLENIERKQRIIEKRIPKPVKVKTP